MLRDPSIRRETRPCDVHGMTEWALYSNGNEGTVCWQCMACRRERSLKYNHEVRAGLREVHHRVEAPPIVCCPSCHMALPACGTCDCDS